MRDFFFDDPFFQSSWDDFDRVREAMFQESRDMWKKFDDDFRNMTCMSNNIMLDSDNRRHESRSMERSSRESVERKSSRQETSSSSRKEESSSSTTNTSNKDNSRSNNNNNNRDVARSDSLSRWESGWMFPRRWMLPSLGSSLDNMDLFKDKDSELIRVKQDNSSIEVSLDTSGYRPDELRVSVTNNIISIEGRHEEKSEDGNKMVSRQFNRKYSLPAGVRAEEVSSNLSSDGVLVVAAGKPQPPALQVKINTEEKK